MNEVNEEKEKSALEEIAELIAGLKPELSKDEILKTLEDVFSGYTSAQDFLNNIPIELFNKYVKAKVSENNTNRYRRGNNVLAVIHGAITSLKDAKPKTRRILV